MSHVRPLVVVVGSINVDLVVVVDALPAAGETVTGGTFSKHQGGKGANQAVAAARFGADVRFVGAVGGDALGEEARAALAADGVDVSRLATIADAPTGVALIVVDRVGQNQIAVASGANARLDRGWVRRSLVGEEAGRPAARGPGVLLTNLEIGDEPLAEAAGLAGELGLDLLVDPAPARPIPRAILEARPLLLPNAGEATRLAGRDDPQQAARELASWTGRPVVVTLGEDGALVVDGAITRRIPGFAVRPLDTTGAGDAVCGAVAVELAEGRPLADAVRTAMAAAALSVTVVGAREGMPVRSSVERFLADRAVG